MANDEYELLPAQLISDLKSEVEALKKKISQPDAKSEELILEIESLKDSIHELNTVFQRALDETKDEDLPKNVKNLSEKLNSIIGQNETIARGMIAISDKLEDFMAKQSGSSMMPPSPFGMPPKVNLGAPTIPGGRVAPMPQMPSNLDYPMNPSESNNSFDFPPPPPGAADKRKRVGLFK